ncbi:hypothetical protein HJFPF1_09627 [Paramyrothecium foliicola]|nr:hypothetical protein HJFPF1_09627 [Paramyrothecium foliicola]
MAFESNVGEAAVDVGMIFSEVIPRGKVGYAASVHTGLFHDTLHATGSPALAVQAVFAKVHQMIYYNRLMKSRNTAPASVTFSLTALMPVRWIGFAIVTGIVMTHLFLVAGVTALFLRFTHNSLMGNHWLAVSQVISDDTTPMLAHASKMRDGDAGSWVMEHSLDLKRRAVLRDLQDGRVALCMTKEDETKKQA